MLRSRALALHSSLPAPRCMPVESCTVCCKLCIERGLPSLLIQCLCRALYGLWEYCHQTADANLIYMPQYSASHALWLLRLVQVPPPMHA